MIDKNMMEYYKDRKRKLEEEKNKLKYEKKATTIFYIIICIICTLFIKRLSLMYQNKYLIYISIIIIAFITVAYLERRDLCNKWLYRTTGDLIKIENEIELLEISTTSLEQRAEKQFKQHQNDLNRYYNENIRQMKGVYNIGLVSIGLGFILIIGTIIFSLSNKDSVNNYIIPVMGIVSGILTSFIGALFIKMYTEAVNTSVKFHDKLVYSNNLHFSNFLISKISDSEKRENAIVELSKTIAEKNNNI